MSGTRNFSRRPTASPARVMSGCARRGAGSRRRSASARRKPRRARCNPTASPLPDMIKHSGISGLVCGLTLLLAAAPLRAQTPPEVGPETRQALRAAKTVRLEVQQEYDLSGENAEGEEAKADEPKAKAGPPKKFSLPLEELAAGMLKLTGWKLAPAGARADVTLTIDVRGTPPGADYVGTVMGRHYTAAELTGSARLAFRHPALTE